MEILTLLAYVALFWIVGKFTWFAYRTVYVYIVAPRFGKNKDVRLLGKWAVVTGSTDGIGKAYAVELANRGMDIVLVSRSPDKLQDVAQEIQSGCPKVEVKCVPYDFSRTALSDYKEVEDALAGLEIGVLVNNVGASYEHPEYFLDVPGGRKTLKTIVDLNCHAAVMMTHMVLPDMLKRKNGAIINIGSTLGRTPAPLFAIYSASKAFLDYFTQSLHIEYGKSGVIFQCIMPMFVVTKMSRVKQKNVLAVMPKQFAKEALDTIGVIDRTEGCLKHAIQGLGFELVPESVAVLLLKKFNNMVRLAALKRKQRIQQEQAKGDSHTH